MLVVAEQINKERREGRGSLVRATWLYRFFDSNKHGVYFKDVKLCKISACITLEK